MGVCCGETAAVSGARPSASATGTGVQYVSATRPDDVVVVGPDDKCAADCPPAKAAGRDEFATDEGCTPSPPSMGVMGWVLGGGPEGGPPFSTMFQRRSCRGAPGTSSYFVDVRVM